MNVERPIFPLKIVLFPEGIAHLKIFEKRYLDMVTDCLKTGTGFCIVASIQSEQNPQLPFASTGVMVNITDIDAQPSLFYIRCLASDKVTIKSAKQKQDGLWVGDIELLDPENEIPVPSDLLTTRVYFERLIASLEQELEGEKMMPFEKPYRLDSCNWLANRWCEILDLSLDEKVKLLELDSPLLRLDIVNIMLSNNQSSGNA
jgi:uncharacterized protein